MPECLTCQAPLGADSINLSYNVCHAHRKCAACRMTVSPREVQFCQSEGLPVKHARCMITSDSKVIKAKGTPATIEVLNLCTLLISDPAQTELFIHDMNFDQKYHFMQGVQAVAAQLSILLRKDKKQFEASLVEREKERQADKPTKRNVIKEAARVGIQTTSEKVARKKLTDRDKAINALLAIGLTREQAESSIQPRNA